MQEKKEKETAQIQPHADNPVRTLYSVWHPQGVRVRVPVDDDNANPQYVIVDGDVWQELIKLGLNPRLRFEKQTENSTAIVEVWCKKPRRYYPLKCFIADVSTEDKVTCLDGNELNLVRNNLVISNKPKPEMYRDYLDPAYGMTATIIQYQYGPEWGFTHSALNMDPITTTPLPIIR